MAARTLPADSTFYQFTLVRKIHYLKILLYGYMITFALPLVVLWLAYHTKGLVLISVEFIFVQLLHSLIAAALLKILFKTASLTWSYQFSIPWIGFLPVSHVSLSILQRIHFHLFWFGLAGIGCLSPWFTTEIILSLGLLHLWILAPRYILFYLLRNEDPTILIKLNPNDISCYLQ